MLFNKLRSCILFFLLISGITGSVRAEFTVQSIGTALKGFVKEHPYWSALGGLIALKCLWDLGSYVYDRATAAKPRTELQGKKLPIVYSPGYNFNLFGLEKVYWFDAKKYQRVHHYLVNRVGIPIESFYKPKGQVALDDLGLVHTQQYLKALEGTLAHDDLQNDHFEPNMRDRLDSFSPANMMSGISGMQLTKDMPGCPINIRPLCWVGDSATKNRILKPMKLATQGTIQAAQLALKTKWAINIGGGYHHTKGKGHIYPLGYLEYRPAFDEADGFCAYGDIQLAIEKLWQINSKLKVMIVDLDAHQGNGHEAYFAKEVAKGDDSRIAIFDMYGSPNYPQDIQARRSIKYDFPLQLNISDFDYLSTLTTNLPKAIAEYQPDFIFYNAGTDILAGDPIGRLNVSEEGVIWRDRFVFEQANKNNISIAMVTSGGYTKQSAEVIGKSIENLLKNVLNVIK